MAVAVSNDIYAGNAGGFTDAQWQAFLTAYYTNLTSVGFVRSEDTGQLDPAAEVFSTISGGSTIYDIRYLNDSLHNQYPLYLRTSWARHSGTYSNAARVTFRLGTGSDGAGNLTGAVSAAVTPTVATSGSPATVSVAASGGSGYAALACDPAGLASFGPNSFSFVLCRTCDNGGNPTGAGAVLFTKDSNTATRTTVFNRQLGTFAYSNTGYGFIPGNRSVSHNPAVALDVYRTWTSVGSAGPMVNPFCLLVHAGEITYGVTLPAEPVLGVPGNYMAIMSNANPAASSASTARLAVKWD